MAYQIIVEACLVDVAKNAGQSKQENAEDEGNQYRRCISLIVDVSTGRESTRELVNSGFPKTSQASLI